MSMNAPERKEKRINPGIDVCRVLQGREGTFALLVAARRTDGWIAQMMCDGVWEGGWDVKPANNEGAGNDAAGAAGVGRYGATWHWVLLRCEVGEVGRHANNTE